MKELQDSRIPDGFMGAISDPAIDEANGFGQDGGQDSAEDVRFDVCRCRASQTSNAQVSGGALLPGNETNLGSWNKGCRYNSALSDALGTPEDGEIGRRQKALKKGLGAEQGRTIVLNGRQSLWMIGDYMKLSVGIPTNAFVAICALHAW